MTTQESNLSAISFVKQIVLDTDSAVQAIIAYQQAFDGKLAALVAAIHAGGDTPQPVVDALTDLVNTSKGLAGSKSALAQIPEQMDASIAAETPVANTGNPNVTG